MIFLQLFTICVYISFANLRFVYEHVFLLLLCVLPSIVFFWNPPGQHFLTFAWFLINYILVNLLSCNFNPATAIILHIDFSVFFNIQFLKNMTVKSIITCKTKGLLYRQTKAKFICKYFVRIVMLNYMSK